MDDRDYHNGLPFGMAGLNKLLSLARPAMQDSDSCERLYDLARSATMRLLRCNRPQEEVERWRLGFLNISGLALGSRAEGSADYLLTAANRFETLAHLLADQNMWMENYQHPGVLDLAVVGKTVIFLVGKGNVKLADCLKALNTKHTSAIAILAEGGYVTWSEFRDGAVEIWLTADGYNLSKAIEAAK